MAKVERTYFESGQLKSEVFVINGCELTQVKNGEYKEYYNNMSSTDSLGQLYIICTYINNKKHGEFKSYYPNGQLWEIYSYIDDKKNGEYISYYENSKLNVICSYTDNIYNGEYKRYHRNGCELSLENSKSKNLSLTDSFGQLWEIYTYINGKIRGEYKRYDENGQLEEISMED